MSYSCSDSHFKSSEDQVKPLVDLRPLTAPWTLSGPLKELMKIMKRMKLELLPPSKEICSIKKMTCSLVFIKVPAGGAVSSAAPAVHVYAFVRVCACTCVFALAESCSPQMATLSVKSKLCTFSSNRLGQKRSGAV